MNTQRLIVKALAIAQSAVVFSGTQSGFGKLQSEISPANFITVEKVATPIPLFIRSTNVGGRQDLYSSDLLYILSLSLAKISVFQFLNKLCVAEIHKIICRWSSLLVAVWTIPVLFTLAFKCGASSPWNLDNGHCIKIVSLNFHFTQVTKSYVLTKQPISSISGPRYP